jgi:hypothetical protein
MMPTLNDHEIHDLLIIPANGALYRCKANPNSENTAPAQAGGYDASPVQQLSFRDPAHRKTLNVARPRLDADDNRTRGPAFAILPNKVDPATSQICCYLVNAENARGNNPWTRDAWSSEPDGKDNSLPATATGPRPELLEVLLAGSTGQVHYVALDDSTGNVVNGPLKLNLGTEGEVFSLLRNGLVVGSALCNEVNRVLPLVNLTALID